uniref:Neprosin PEP catalytic domain-containing protein n=1 Tax=Aegilops tauschii TaxID=37682 RepID=M8BMM8_AEGTA
MKVLPQIVATILVAYLTLALGVKVNTHQTSEEEDFQEIIKKHVKRTVSTKFGELFDCVDIDQQPTLHHPLLKNHSLQDEMYSVDLIHKEIAGIKTDGDIYGARVTLNIYEPQVKEHGDFSSQVLTLMHGEDGPLEAIAVGSMVSQTFGDSFARFHMIWLGNNQKSCMDFHCQGFVQTLPHIGVGARISPVSTYNGKQVDLQLMLFQMGSGHFAAEGNGKAAYAWDVKIVDSSYKLVDLNFDKSFAYSTKPPCYTVDSFDHNSDGAHVYYGGPGGCHPSVQ